MTKSGFEIPSLKDIQDKDFSKSDNLENETVTCKSKAYIGFLLLVSRFISKMIAQVSSALDTNTSFETQLSREKKALQDERGEIQ